MRQLAGWGWGTGRGHGLTAYTGTEWVRGEVCCSLMVPLLVVAESCICPVQLHILTIPLGSACQDRE